jgi:hypothetical protein
MLMVELCGHGNPIFNSLFIEVLFEEKIPDFCFLEILLLNILEIDLYNFWIQEKPSGNQVVEIVWNRMSVS